MRILLFFLAISATSLHTAAETKRDAHHWNSLIGRGVNLGNALDAPKEGAWGVTLEENYFSLIANAGFDSVRVPVRWSAHAAKSAPYTIDKTFLDRVDWAIDQALSNKLVTIVNIHHYDEIYPSPEEHKTRLLALWKQLAEHYKNYPDTLYFEILNEPNGKLTNELWNQYAAEAIQVIRKTNPSRAIVIGPGQWNNITQLKKLKLPAEDKNLIVTFHYYLPFKFTHQGASWVGEKSKGWLGTQWTGSDQEKQELRAHFDTAQGWAKEQNRPLYMGEFGAYSKADPASRARWTAFVRSEAEKRNFSWAYWEFCSGFGVYDSSSKKWRTDLLHSLIPKN
ncbi:MAG: glycoside hydrolase family 5 protein [Verrucomicrobia bacterium]|nr:glycoside hydrolase family 5 protein [Verrucomicrobiota bacterium]